MKMTQRNFNRVMKIEDLSVRKGKLELMALSLCFHGALWQMTVDEIERLNKLGVKSPAQRWAEKIAEKKGDLK